MSRRNGAGVGDPGLRHRMRGEERRIEGQHEQLDALCREVRAELERGGTEGALDNYLHFVDALEAHMKVEEEIYFPALHGLREELSEELTALVEAHHVFRGQAEDLRTLFEEHDRLAARDAIERLALEFAAHEAAEEELMARVNEPPVESSST